MYINTEETKALLVTGERLQHKLHVETASLQLCVNATNITQISHYKLQGLIIDKDLFFEEKKKQRKNGYNKLSNRLGLLALISPYLKQSHKLIFYLSLIKPVMLYLSPI